MSKDNLAPFDAKLKLAAEEIKQILRRHDIAGVVCIASGTGHSEFVNELSPSWSAITIEPPGIRFKVKAKTGGAPEKAKANKTVNMIYCMHDTLAKLFMQYDKIKHLVDQHFKVEAEEAVFTPDQSDSGSERH